ncbi:MAG: OmpA family protein [Deltaproteobacteria bacterium]|nr:OmpA family protein [Deltaproteobacteria bacterium]
MMTKRLFITLATMLFVAAGCATSGGLTRKDVLQQYDTLGKLSKELTASEGNGADLLAPEGFNDAKEQLEEAVAYAQDGKKTKADASAENGLGILDLVNRHMDESRELMSEVLATRERARAAGAPGLFPTKYENLEARMRKATTLIEHGKTEKALEMRPDLLNDYSELELKALKKGTIAAAKAAIDRAEESEADDYAPKTLKLAEEEIKLVPSVLEADRTQTEKAEAHAERVIWLSSRAEAITELAKMFEDRDYTSEDIVLWYQDQLDIVNEPITGDLPFNEANRVVVDGLRETVASFMKALDDARDMIEKNQARIEELEKKSAKKRAELEKIIKKLLSASRKELVSLRKKYSSMISDEGKKSAETERLELETKERFEYVSSLFKDSEATVTLDGTNILILITGLQFKPGGTEIKARNFGLMNKVISAIRQFPKSKIEVSGHTDSKGGADRNLSISMKRSANVEKFMTEVGGIDKERVKSKGYGEKKPVASNDSRKGRAKNRRLEVLIINK